MIILRTVATSITFAGILLFSTAQATTAVVHKPTTYHHNAHYHYVRPAPVVTAPNYSCKTVCTPNANGNGVHCAKRCG